MSVNVFCKQLAQELPPHVRVVMIWDGAGIHRSFTVRVPLHVTFVELPLYRQELNPIENLWHNLKDHHRNNRAYANYNTMLADGVDMLQAYWLGTQRMQAVCNAPLPAERA